MQFARAAKVETHVVGRSRTSLEFATSLGADGAWLADELPDLRWDAVIDATDDRAVPAIALDLVEPGGRVVYIGLSGEPSTIDTRQLAFKDVTAVGILSGSPGLTGAIERYATGLVDPRPLVGATVGLDQVADVLAGWRPTSAGPGPKIHVDPRPRSAV